MKMKSRMLGIALLGAAFLASQAQANVITFDDLGNLIVVTNQYANVVFSAGGGDVIQTTSQNPPYLGSAPNLICTASITQIPDCIHDVILNFTVPVNNLVFDAFMNDSTQQGVAFALLDLYENGSLTPTATLSLTVKNYLQRGAGYAADHQDLNADNGNNYSGITRMVIRNNTDAGGSAYDNFSFTLGEGPVDPPVDPADPPVDPADPPVDPGVVPEPSTLLLTGLCGIVWVGRRFLTRKSM